MIPTWDVDRFARGHWARGNYPYGYASSDLVPDPVEAGVVRQVFEQIEAGYNTSEIAAGLNAHGVRTRRGCKWTRFNMRNIIKNRAVYMGTHIRHPETGELVPSPVPREPLI